MGIMAGLLFFSDIKVATRHRALQAPNPDVDFWK